MNADAIHEVIDGLEVLICGLDAGGTISVFNRSCERLTGLSRAQAIGLSWLELFAAGQRAGHVLTLWGEAREREASGPYEALCRNNRNVRWQFSRHPKQGVPRVTLWAVGVDITEEREALVRARDLERMVALGNLVSGLTHELRNPLNGALLQLALADRTLARHPDEPTRVAAAAIAQASGEIRRIATLLDEFLIFARPQPLRLERADVRELVERAIERSAVRSRAADTVIVVEPGAPTVAEVDTGRVISGVFQLLSNAIDAVQHAADRVVRVRISTSGNTVAIEVEDRGAGLPEDRTPIFEPFFTTKQGGTGLGLSIVQRVAADHGGSIACARRDEATVFRLELPIIGGVAN